MLNVPPNKSELDLNKIKSELNLNKSELVAKISHIVFGLIIWV